MARNATHRLSCVGALMYRHRCFRRLQAARSLTVAVLMLVELAAS